MICRASGSASSAGWAFEISNWLWSEVLWAIVLCNVEWLYLYTFARSILLLRKDMSVIMQGGIHNLLSKICPLMFVN